MNRGRRGEEIFTADEDRGIFADLVTESVEQWKVKVAAYCLLSNHDHLLIQIPDADLSRCMRNFTDDHSRRRGV
jgi:putative transposase